VPDKVRIALVDDHPLLRDGVAGTLSADPMFEVVGHGESAEDALRLAEELLPDVMLLDVSMAGGGIAAARAIAQSCPVIRLVMLTVSEDEEDVTGALKAGARGYILKGVSGPELIRIIKSIVAGDAYITPALAAALLGELKPAGQQATVAGRIADLTIREREILELVAEALSNKEIAARLNLTEKTVKFYMTNILQKLQVRNRVEAALIAREVGPAP
jgi:DNA-binding NarL/FixJ family response regulator